MKGITKDIIFVVIMGIFGIATSLGIISILLAIAMPSRADLLLTVKEKIDYEAAQTGLLFFLGTHANVLLWALIAFTVIAFFIVLIELNPNFSSMKKDETNRKKVVVVVLSGVVLFVILAVIQTWAPFSFISDMALNFVPGTNLAYGFMMVIVSGALWLVVGEMGWAGDFTSWGFGNTLVTSRGARIAGTFFMGAVCGGIAYFFFTLSNWAFDKYFLLVSEVLARSNEPTLHGWHLLGYALMVLLGFSFAIIAGFVTVLAPRHMTIKARLIRLIIPAILLAIYAPIIAGKYHDAVARYDLNKKSLAEAVGVPEKGQTSKTVVLFVPGGPSVQEWRMEASGSGLMIYNNTYALSPENITKIEDYLARHKDGSVFFYAGQDAVMKGHYNLWETEKGNARMSVNANTQLLSRMVLLSRLKSLPVTAENERYLRSFADETKWYAGKSSSLRIAEAFMHFGRLEEAKTWADKAKAKGADLTKSTILVEPVLTNATVTGTIKLNGTPLEGKKIALFPYKPNMKQIDPKSLLSGLPIDSKTTDPAGRFEFTNLGKGDYVLAVMTEKEEVPFKVPAGGLNIENAPAIIALDAAAAVKNLGDINLIVRK